MSNEVSQFIDQKGGPSAVAAATGYAANAVYQWKHRNTLPRSAWPEVMKSLDGVTLDDLLALEAATKGRAA